MLNTGGGKIRTALVRNSSASLKIDFAFIGQLHLRYKVTKIK
jgi:hypothetical protein